VRSWSAGGLQHPRRRGLGRATAEEDQLRIEDVDHRGQGDPEPVPASSRTSIATSSPSFAAAVTSGPATLVELAQAGDRGRVDQPVPGQRTDARCRRRRPRRSPGCRRARAPALVHDDVAELAGEPVAPVTSRPPITTPPPTPVPMVTSTRSRGRAGSGPLLAERCDGGVVGDHDHRGPAPGPGCPPAGGHGCRCSARSARCRRGHQPGDPDADRDTLPGALPGRPDQLDQGPDQRPRVVGGGGSTVPGQDPTARRPWPPAAGSPRCRCRGCVCSPVTSVARPGPRRRMPVQRDALDRTTTRGPTCGVSPDGRSGAVASPAGRWRLQQRPGGCREVPGSLGQVPHQLRAGVLQRPGQRAQRADATQLRSVRDRVVGRMLAGTRVLLRPRRGRGGCRPRSGGTRRHGSWPPGGAERLDRVDVVDPVARCGCTRGLLGQRGPPGTGASVTGSPPGRWRRTGPRGPPARAGLPRPHGVAARPAAARCVAGCRR
jgi:hypothetical protein